MGLFINQLKIRLSEATPDNELIERILSGEERDWKYQLKLVDENEYPIEFAYLEEIVHYLCYRNIDMVRKIAKARMVSNKDLTRIAEITYDFAVWKNIPKTAFFIVDNFMLDEKKTTYGFLHYLRELINEGDYQRASEIVKNYKGKVIPEQMRQWGCRLFEQAMTFSKSETERDYTKAFKIKEIFSLKPELTESHALIQYRYNMSKGNHLTAAEIARILQLDKRRMKKAAIMVFKSEFDKFKKKFGRGEYHERISLTLDNPYVQSVSILKDYAIMEEKFSTDPSERTYYGEASDAAFSFLKRIISLPESEKVSFFTKSFLSASLIADYNLMDMKNVERATASDQIIGQITRKLDEIITNINQAELYYKPVLRLFNIFSSHRLALKYLACRLFDIFVENDKIELSHKTYTDFALEKREILETLMNRCLILLKLKKIEEFAGFIERFSIVSDLKKVDEFMEQLHPYFDKYIYDKCYDAANTVQSIFKFPKKRVVSSAVYFCRRLMLNEEDDEVIKIMDKFNLSNRDLSKVFNEIYNIRITHSWKKGYDFRMKFGISVMDVGLFKWLFGEILRFNRIVYLYLGEEIDVEKKKSD
ncbi:MAG: hypothetical protein HWN67_14045 [Candidatus Helarchaeota archaeon]|nr:hypothetical protein [Candidatus Helarchaeota archaeon]